MSFGIFGEGLRRLLYNRMLMNVKLKVRALILWTVSDTSLLCAKAAPQWPNSGLTHSHEGHKVYVLLVLKVSVLEIFIFT